MLISNPPDSSNIVKFLSYNIKKLLTPGIENICVAFLTKSKQSKQFKVVKAEKKSLKSLSQIFNTYIGVLPKSLKVSCTQIASAVGEGEHILRKPAFVSQMVVYKK